MDLGNPPPQMAKTLAADQSKFSQLWAGLISCTSGRNEVGALRSGEATTSLVVLGAAAAAVTGTMGLARRPRGRPCKDSRPTITAMAAFESELGVQDPAMPLVYFAGKNETR